MPTSDLSAQYRAAKQSAVVFDLTGWTILTLDGRDCVTFLNNFCTNDVKKLPPGEGFEAFVTNVKARVLCHILVFADPDPLVGFTLFAAPRQAESLIGHLDRYLIREQVTIRDWTSESGLLCVTGPRAAKLMRSVGIQPPEDPIRRDDNDGKEIVFKEIEQAIHAAARQRFGEKEQIEIAVDRRSGDVAVTIAGKRLMPDEMEDLLSRIGGQTTKQAMIQKIREAERGGPASVGRFTSRAMPVRDSICTMMRADLVGLPCYLIQGSRSGIESAVEQLDAAGVNLADAAVFEALRIEAAFPLSGVDVTEDHLAPEVDRPWAISYTKGCYLGQEPIARIDALGHVNRLLRGLRLESGPVPERGAVVTADGKEIGTVTSAATTFADGWPVALAYVRSKFAEPDSVVGVRMANGDVPATVYTTEPRP